jgi:hypothetical protein
MAVLAQSLPNRALSAYKQWLPDLRMGLENLLAHRLRSLLTCSA